MDAQKSACKRTLRRLKAWLDGEVSPALAVEVERHLEQCPSCRRREGEFRRVSDLLRQADPGPFPEARPRAVRKQAVEAQREAEATVRFLQRAAAAAALVLILASSAVAWPWLRGDPQAVQLGGSELQVLKDVNHDQALTAFLAGGFEPLATFGDGGF